MSSTRTRSASSTAKSTKKRKQEFENEVEDYPIASPVQQPVVDASYEAKSARMKKKPKSEKPTPTGDELPGDLSDLVTGAPPVLSPELTSSSRSKSAVGHKFLGGSSAQTVYANEIAKMMHTFGDVRTPDRDTVELIERAVQKYLRDLIVKAAQLNPDPNSARSRMHEFVFLFRKNSDILKRFEKGRLFRKQAKTADADTEALGFKKSSSSKKKPRKGADPEYPGPLQTWFDHLEGLTWFPEEKESDFLSETEQWEDDWASQLVAKEKHRAELMDAVSRSLSLEEYVDYSKCREASFTYHAAKKFTEWVNAAALGVELPDDVFEILGFIAWSSVGLLTQSALIIKRNMDILSVYPPPSTPTLQSFVEDAVGIGAALVRVLPEDYWPKLTPVRGASVVISPSIPIGVNKPGGKSEIGKKAAAAAAAAATTAVMVHDSNPLAAANPSTQTRATIRHNTTPLQPVHVREALRRIRPFDV